MDSLFFKQFLMLTDIKTFIFIALLAGLFFVMHQFSKNKVSFASRVMLATGIGLVLGVLMQSVAGFPDKPIEVAFIRETTTWYGLFGYGFIDLIRMLVIPLVMIAIMHVILTMEEGAQISRMVRQTIIITMSMVAISVVVGLAFGLLFNLGAGIENAAPGTAQIKEVKSIVATLRGLLPQNPIKSMVDLNIIALVIFSVFIAVGAKRMAKKYLAEVKPFFDLINALHKIIISVAMSIIKLMPYAVIPLLANTIATHGLTSILEVGKFIAVLYLATACMYLLQLVALMAFRINPLPYLKKSLHVAFVALTSRSSIGTLPLTIDTLTNKLGVNYGTASFVASFGTTAGMQGCAGIFPALLVVFVCNMGGTPIDLTLLLMSVIVISIGSLGIAGIPGTATMAASVSLSGVGMASAFPLISPILAVDPFVDMGRTMLNVTGAMTNALMVDQSLGQLDHARYADMTIPETAAQEI